jgi:phosphoribosylformylglycinamidine synthase
MGQELGARVQLADVPLKYPGLQPWEIWLSEAQERMVFAVPPANWDAFREICAAHDVEAVCIGTFAPTGQLSLFYGDRPVGDISMDFLHGGIPRREMKAEWSKGKAESNGQKPETSVPTESLNDSLLALLTHPTIRSKADIVHRYDHEVGSGTAVKPLVGRGAGPGDAAVVVPLDILSVPLTPQPPLPQGARGSLVYGLSETSGPETKKNRAIDGRPQRLAEISERFQKIMLEIARKLRKEHTPSEDMLWQQLRGSKFEGLKFRRQHPIGAFVLDFYCPELMLAIEVDGPIHDDQIEADQLRQEIIEETGIRFLRVSAEEVEYRLAETLEKIRAQIPPRPLWERGLGGEGSEVAIRAIALSVGMCPQYNAHDPYAMAWAAVDEAVRNAVCVGADPDQISILDNFSWGNTQLPDRLGSLVRCAQGCYDAALAYGTPFVSGKDSLNNEYVGQDGQRHSIPGTLVISALGIVPDANQTVTSDFKQAGDLIYLVGTTRPEELGGSAYAELTGYGADGVVPQPVRDALATYRALHQAIIEGYVTAAHDASEGGLAVALAEMCIGGQIGAEVNGLEANAAALFSESAGRIVVTVGPDDAADFEAILGAACTPIGTVGGNALTIGAVVSAKVSELAAAWGGQLPLTPEPSSDRSPSNTQPSAFPLPAINSLQSAKPVLILHAAGSNRDRDAVLACELAGGAPEIVTVNQLVRGERHVQDYAMLVIPGGFSYGDDLGAGVLWALDLRERIPGIEAFVSAGKPVMGICNGFQTLVKSGFLPGSEWDDGRRSITLTYNEGGRFECRWVTLEANPQSPCLFTEGITEPIECPIAHGEGRVMVADEATRLRMWKDGLPALTYVGDDYPANPNGSVDAIAGLSNPAGNVFGLMPHPENHLFPWQHPQRVRGFDGLRLFENGIRRA